MPQLDVTPVEPGLVLEVSVDVAREASGPWRHPTRRAGPSRRGLLGAASAAQKLLALDIPGPTILTVLVCSALVGLSAALVPAFRAGRMNVLNAIATDG
ncbi:hypothetical protein ACF058_26250 [Streptomyces sp. NPDC015501]|uniref:hypothetical protein n=1 Tax=unclassified Streptomyces TaxID=2593676 RepID=UPI00119ED663|nr:hypothetical protein A3L22_27040 [Streptomyces griseus subsp. griseus]WSS59581.1 hypothetical protein OG543_29420 [Streptomyces sp. NBC_01178]